MNIYIFGNPDVTFDNNALKIASNSKIENINYVFVKPNEDLPFDNGSDVVIMDQVEGIEDVRLFELTDDRSITLGPRVSAHDFDLGFQLRYLKKLNKIGKVTILGIPMNKKVNYKYVQSILRKLVAQDIQGS